MAVVDRPSREDLVGMYGKRWSIVEIARHYGVGATTVKKWFKELQIERRGQGSGNTPWRT